MKIPEVILVCPNCGVSYFLVSKGMYYCAPNFNAEKGCGWVGTRDQLRKVGKTPRDQNQLDFEEEYLWKDEGPSWCRFWMFWWNNVKRDDEQPDGDKNHGIALALSLGLIKKRDKNARPETAAGTLDEIPGFTMDNL